MTAASGFVESFPRLVGRGRTTDLPLVTSHRLSVPRNGPRRFGLLLTPAFSGRALVFHPLVELRLLELPAITQFECRNLGLGDVLIKGVGTYSQILRGLPDVHYFSRLGHKIVSPFRRCDSRQARGKQHQDRCLRRIFFNRRPASAYVAPDGLPFSRGEVTVARVISVIRYGLSRVSLGFIRFRLI